MFKNEEGFSLLELVVAVGVAGIIAAVALPTFAGLQAKAEANSATYAASASAAEALANSTIGGVNGTTSNNSSYTGGSSSQNGFSIYATTQFTLNSSASTGTGFARVYLSSNFSMYVNQINSGSYDILFTDSNGNSTRLPIVSARQEMGANLLQLDLGVDHAQAGWSFNFMTPPVVTGETVAVVPR